MCESAVLRDSRVAEKPSCARAQIVETWARTAAQAFHHIDMLGLNELLLALCLAHTQFGLLNFQLGQILGSTAKSARQVTVLVVVTS